MSPKKVKLCGRWEVQINSLWLWWYCGLMLAMESYLMYRAVVKCKRYNEFPWNSPDKPVMELYIYIALIVISIMCIPFFILTCLFQIGNYANDGTRLGRDNIHQDSLQLSMQEQESNHNELRGQKLRTQPSRLQTLWRHSGPLCHSFHIVAAFTLLLPTAVLQAQEIKYGFLHPGMY